MEEATFKGSSEEKGDRPLFSGTVPFSPFVKKNRDCPSSLKKRGLSPFLFLSFFLHYTKPDEH
jgi:hypothetical protein